MKMTQDNRTECSMGFRAKFQDGMVTGSISTSGKATSVYKHMIEMMEVSIITEMDLSKPKDPFKFGLSLNLGGV